MSSMLDKTSALTGRTANRSNEIASSASSKGASNRPGYYGIDSKNEVDFDEKDLKISRDWLSQMGVSTTLSNKSLESAVKSFEKCTRIRCNEATFDEAVVKMSIVVIAASGIVGEEDYNEHSQRFDKRWMAEKRSRTSARENKTAKVEVKGKARASKGSGDE